MDVHTSSGPLLVGALAPCLSFVVWRWLGARLTVQLRAPAAGWSATPAHLRLRAPYPHTPRTRDWERQRARCCDRTRLALRPVRPSPFGFVGVSASTAPSLRRSRAPDGRTSDTAHLDSRRTRSPSPTPSCGSSSRVVRDELRSAGRSGPGDDPAAHAGVAADHATRTGAHGVTAPPDDRRQQDAERGERTRRGAGGGARRRPAAAVRPSESLQQRTRPSDAAADGGRQCVTRRGSSSSRRSGITGGRGSRCSQRQQIDLPLQHDEQRAHHRRQLDKWTQPFDVLEQYQQRQ